MLRRELKKLGSIYRRGSFRRMGIGETNDCNDKEKCDLLFLMVVPDCILLFTGRVLRGKTDYGIMILADKRFSRYLCTVQK
jgi:hypothetical protein